MCSCPPRFRELEHARIDAFHGHRPIQVFEIEVAAAAARLDGGALGHHNFQIFLGARAGKASLVGAHYDPVRVAREFQRRILMGAIRALLGQAANAFPPGNCHLVHVAAHDMRVAAKILKHHAGRPRTGLLHCDGVLKSFAEDIQAARCEPGPGPP